MIATSTVNANVHSIEFLQEGFAFDARSSDSYFELLCPPQNIYYE